MKIQAVLPEASLSAVLERLSLIGIEEVIVSSVRTNAKHEDVRSFRGARYVQELVDQCALECWPDDDVEPAVRAIRHAIEKTASEATIVVTHTDDLSAEP